jgi:hypothetical protein
MKSRLGNSWIGGVIAALCLSIAVAPISGCNKVQQDTVATLAQTLGNAAAQVSSLEGNPALATQITTDTNAAVQAITTYVPGTSASQTVIQLINVVMADLSLVPVIGPYAGLIDLALGTAEALIAAFSAKTNTPVATGQTATHIRAVHLTNAPKTRKDFVNQWNSIVKANPQLAPALLK